MIWWTSEMMSRSSSSTVEERTSVSTKACWEREVGPSTRVLCNSYLKDTMHYTTDLEAVDNEWLLPGSVAYIRIYYAYIMWFSSLILRCSHQKQIKVNFLCLSCILTCRSFPICVKTSPRISLQSYILPEWPASGQAQLLLWVQTQERHSARGQTWTLWILWGGGSLSLLQVMIMHFYNDIFVFNVKMKKILSKLH